VARQEYKVQTNNFTGGLITEASPLSFPENSCLDIVNMDINIDGSVSRRHATRLQTGTNPVSSIPYSAYKAQSPIYVWRQAGGIPGQNLVCVQDGNFIRFYYEQENLGAGTIVPSINLVTYRTEAIVEQPPVSMTSVRDVLVITGVNIKPIYVEYAPGSPPTFTVTEIQFSVRDLDGLDDGSDVDSRPVTLTSEHIYNLLNQGWDAEKIDAFFVSQGRYPSNADIWSAGRNATNDFDPTELVKLDFGTSPAPKGRFLQNPFDTTQAYATYSGASQNMTGLTFITASQLEITATAHGLSSGDDIYVADLILSCGGVHREIEGVYTVSNVTANTFQFIISTCSSGSVVDLGKFYTENVGLVTGAGYVTNKRPSVVATYAGRAFYAGIPFDRLSNQVFFSQILTDTGKRLGKCLQEADPTSEIDSDIVATDGGVITINGLGNVVAMREQQQNLVIFTSNGIWEIRGEADSFFSATGYAVRKITSVPCVAGQSVVDVEGTLMFMGEDGLYMLQPNEISGLLNAVNMTAGTIKTHYLRNVAPCAPFTAGAYDYKRRQVLWFHGVPEDQWPSVLPGGDLPEKGRLMTNTLVFNLDTQSFTKYKFPFKYPEALTPDDTTVRIFGATNIRGIAESSPAVRLFTRYVSGGLSYVGWLTLDKPKEDGFADSTFTSGSGALEEDSLVVTGHATLGDVGVKKTARQIILHMKRTEKGFTISGETYTPIHPSSAKVRIAWDFTTDEASNKWQAEFQGYRYRQLAIPSSTLPTHVGYDVITTKTKLRGTGRAFSMRFKSEPGHDMNILGWSITGSAEASE
jgi:hypothetical protein